MVFFSLGLKNDLTSSVKECDLINRTNVNSEQLRHVTQIITLLD